MRHYRKFFTPGHVDEQVEQLAQNSKMIRLPRNERTQESVRAEERLVLNLEAYYQAEQQKDTVSLEQAWKRVSARIAGHHESPHPANKPLLTDTLRFSQERTLTMRNQVPARPTGRKWLQRLSILAAILVTALLVGGLVTVLNLSHRQSTIGSQHGTATPKITPTSIPLPIGTTIYTTPPDAQGYSGLTWSPDSKRIASLNSKGIQIWDAATGQHLVNVHLSGSNEWAWGLVWSPNDQQVAIGTNQRILIVDGQTGQTVRSYTGSQVFAPIAPAVTGTSYLSSRFPTSGGFGFRATAWSPDSHFMASAVSFGSSGKLLVWNPQTGALAFTLQVSGSYVISSVAWSSDGKYLAAHAYNTQGGDPLTQSSDLALVWSVATHQVVFRHLDGMPGSDAPVLWQPQSNNLAFVGITRSGSDYIETLEIWNVTTGKLIKQYPRMGGYALTWSPDGKDLAYDGYIGSGKNAVNAVIIIDASSGQQIYAYTGHKYRVSVLAWSPDGKYIVSGEGTNMVIKDGKPTTLPGVAKVWSV